MTGEILLIRADASAEIGAGHVMRCLALAQAWRRAGGRTIFALAAGAEKIQKRICSDGAEVVQIEAEPGSRGDARRTRELCQESGAAWLALDGFHFLTDYCASVRNGSSHLLLVDDHGERAPYACDLVLNVNPQASSDMYVLRGESTQVLLGPRYALIRQEFLKFEDRRPDVPDRARRVLVTFGGADLHNVTLKVFQALEKIHDSLDITVIAGASNPHYASLRAAVDQSSHNAKLLLNVENMPELMSQSDLAITAGGGTCFELAFLKVPMLLVTIAGNHERTVEAYHDAGAAIAAGWFHSLTRESLVKSLQELTGDRKLRRELQENASRLVDGRGAERVVETMLIVRGNVMSGEEPLEPAHDN